MKFENIAAENNEVKFPFAAKKNRKWISGSISAHILNENFGEYETATEMKNNTNSERWKLFFDHLAEKGHIPK